MNETFLEFILWNTGGKIISIQEQNCLEAKRNMINYLQDKRYNGVLWSCYPNVLSETVKIPTQLWSSSRGKRKHDFSLLCCSNDNVYKERLQFCSIQHWLVFFLNTVIQWLLFYLKKNVILIGNVLYSHFLSVSNQQLNSIPEPWYHWSGEFLFLKKKFT